MSIPNPTGSRPDFDLHFTLPEPPRAVDPLETPAPGDLTTPQLPGLGSSGVLTYPGYPHRSPPTPGLPDVPGYDLNNEIARGGMGVVYAARERALGREVAIKVLLPELAANRQVCRLFLREARITAKLPHPGVPPVHAVGTLPDGRPFLAMKLIHGRTLAAILTARAQRATTESVSDLELTAPDAPGLLLVFEQICQAVAFAHSLQIVHRDLKPHNIMVGPFGEVQVMDWGLARETPRKPKFDGETVVIPHPPPSATSLGSSGTQHGAVKGTPAFMPPEQALGHWDVVDERADVFALGGLLCSLLTGSPPYTGDNVRAVVARARAADLDEAFARLDRCGASENLVRLAKWCLSPDPAQRPTDARAVASLVELYRLSHEDQVRRFEKDRAAVAGAEAVARWANLRASALVCNEPEAEGTSELCRRLLVGVAAGQIIAYGIGYSLWALGLVRIP